MAKKRNGRQDAIRDIVRNKNIRTQRMLVDELKACGYDCTQATVSRDIADMGLRKLPEGVYVLAEDLHLQRMVSELVIEVLRTENLVLIKALSIAFDVVLAWASMKLVGLYCSSNARRLAAFFLVLFLPTVVLNGAYWGQCDSIYTAFAVLALYLALDGRTSCSSL